MSRNTLVVAGLALILAIGALVLPFVWRPDTGGATVDLSGIQADIEQLKQSSSSQSMKVAYMDAEAAFLVFVSAVSDLRQQITDKNAEKSQLSVDFSQGAISQEEATRRGYVIEAELLDARMTTAAGTLDRMIASEKFADLRSALVTLSDQGQPVVDAINELVSTIRVGAIDANEFQLRLAAYTQAFNEFDGYVTSAATTKLVQATEKVANAYGYDLVVRKKDVIMYRNPATVDDITDLVKAEIADYL